ncbi:MAG: undecaprenyldiphospho-muramoylpentapeptide beta-N-acetylglucosaminyltransferase [Clostridia bacterium]|nr:undecaprenyldiphospho-muramoylpentapeptide beta-N-acetylglucosaminyltransferase [Clostridia bacterium]
MKVLMTGGGTGGHVNPAIAIADKIMEKEPGSNIAFVGTPRGIENKLVPAAGYKLYHIDIRGLRRSLSVSNFRTVYLMAVSQIKARRLIRDFNPDIVVGTGGYVCWPLVNAASKMNIPTVLHESNAVPGVAVKLLQNKVDRIYVNFEATLSKLSHPERAKRVGNPLRGHFGELTREQAREKLGYNNKYRYVILSCGGSMGAERVNEEVLKLMRDYTSKDAAVKHIHATGSIEYEASKAVFQKYGLDKCPNLELCEYIYDMPLKMTAADLVISRAGAITLSELAVQRKPCILIPSPNVTDNHQYKNAKVLGDAGASLVFEESELGDGILTDAVKQLLPDRKRLHEMSDSISSFAVRDCADLLYSELRGLIDQKNSL